MEESERGQLTITLPDELESEIREAVRGRKYGSVSDFARDAFKGELSGRPTYWERFLAVHVLENNRMLKSLTDNQNWDSGKLLEAYGYDSSGVEDEQLAKAVLFERFDGNAGDGYLGFTNFLVDNGRFATVRPLDKIPHLNSHSMVNDMYRRMLDEYKAIMAKKERWHMEPLTLGEAKHVIAAQIHPENRA